MRTIDEEETVMPESQMSRREFVAATAPIALGAAVAVTPTAPHGSNGIAESLQYQKGGTILRGPDGVLYLIPDEKLAALRLPEPQALELRKLTESPQPAVAPLLSAVGGKTAYPMRLAASDSTTVTVVNVGAFRQLRI